MNDCFKLNYDLITKTQLNNNLLKYFVIEVMNNIKIQETRQ